MLQDDAARDRKQDVEHLQRQHDLDTHTTSSVGRIAGSVTWRNVCQGDAPSIRAARPSTAGTARSAPSSSTASSGVARHTTATSVTTRLGTPSVVQRTGAIPNAPSAVVHEPNRVSNTRRQNTPSASGATAHGSRSNRPSNGRRAARLLTSSADASATGTASSVATSEKTTLRGSDAVRSVSTCMRVRKLLSPTNGRRSSRSNSTRNRLRPNTPATGGTTTRPTSSSPGSSASAANRFVAQTVESRADDAPPTSTPRRSDIHRNYVSGNRTDSPVCADRVAASTISTALSPSSADTSIGVPSAIAFVRSCTCRANAVAHVGGRVSPAGIRAVEIVRLVHDVPAAVLARPLDLAVRGDVKDRLRPDDDVACPRPERGMWQFVGHPDVAHHAVLERELDHRRGLQLVLAVEFGLLSEHEPRLCARVPADDVAAVRAPVEKGAAFLRRIRRPVVGSQAGAAGLAAPRLDHPDVADLAVVDHAARDAARFHAPRDLADGHLHARRVGRVDHLAALVAVQAHRLLEKDVLARPGGRERLRQMGRMRRRDHDGIDVGPVEHLLERRDVLHAVLLGKAGRALADGHAHEPRVLRVVLQRVRVHAGHQARTHDPETDAHDPLLNRPLTVPRDDSESETAPGRAPNPRSRVRKPVELAASRPR